MIKEIQYLGYSTEPSDYECPDGQLAASLNLINEDNRLKPVFQPKDLANMPAGHDVVYIHETASFAHYIVRNGQKLLWLDAGIITDARQREKSDKTKKLLPIAESVISAELAKTSPTHLLKDFDNVEIYSVNGIGNTVIVLTSGGMHYFLWKSDTEGYLYLGTHIPECPLSFGLQGEVVSTDAFNVDINPVSSGTSEVDEANRKILTDSILAKMNKFIADNSVNEGRFIYPFFVRYAYRLYDGSLTMHSSPVLMPCCTSGSPLASCNTCRVHDGKINSLVDIMIVAVRHQLDYAAQLASRIEMLKEWKDIVQSVDIFISKPIYTYDQNGEIKDIASHGVGFSTVCKHVNQDSSVDRNKQPLKYRYRSCLDMFEKTYVGKKKAYHLGVGIPYKDDKQIEADIRSCAQFYLLKSIKVEDLKTTRTIIPVEKDYLQSLVNREVMTDDYDSHDRLIPKYVFGYNSRLNISNMKKNLYDAFNTADMVVYSDADITEDDNEINVPNHRYRLFFFIKQDSKEIIVEGETSELSADAPFFYLYYPNPNAYKVVINDISANEYFEYPLERHGFLNGAYCFRGFNFSHRRTYVDPVAESTDKIVNVPSKIYTSEVNNPFLFPALSINTVGTGAILGISAAAKAMSQGQFGQFPLYAFTTEGVWALEVSSTGTYSARQPITRDVCINADSITQIDSSVLFATDRGIMLISGSQTQCVTDGIFAETPFNVLDLPGMEQLHAKLGHAADACLPVQPFLGFLEHCQMAYDYVHQRIFVFNPTQVTEDGVTKARYTYAYVYSLKSQRWGMVYSNLAATINSYPDALAMTQDNRLVSFSDTAEDESKGLYVTRPLKLEAADVHKTISALIQRGHFQRGDVATVLYGSRDLYNWRLIWSSKDHYLRGFRGTPYKYFRIAGLSKLTDGKSVFGASIALEPRLANQLR